jgi:GNAT superfamily N-acetyltransferase
MNPFLRLFNNQHTLSADIRSVTGLDTPLGQQVVRIYEQSFPEAERDPVEDITANLRNADPDMELTRLRALVEQDEVVGFTLFASYKDYYLGYLKFIAVRADIRGKGYGPLLLQDAIQQLRADGRRATGWPYLGLVLEVERPESAESEADRRLRERRIQFYRRNGALMFDDVDYVAPPVAPGQPSLPFRLMFIRAVHKYGMQHWLRRKAVQALLVEGYGESPDSWFVRHALEVRQRARQAAQRSLIDARK